MGKYQKGRSKKRGLPPGTLVAAQPRVQGKAVELELFYYDATGLQERHVQGVQNVPAIGAGQVAWINVDGPDPACVQMLGERFGLHPLVQEDILNADQRPKLEDYGDYIYIVLKMLTWESEGHEVLSEQVSLVLGKDFVLTLQERPGDVFDPIRERLRAAKGKIRASGSDHLAYSLLDAVTDGYFVVLEQIGERIEQLEESILSGKDQDGTGQLHHLKSEALMIRRALWPLRDVISSLERGGSALIQPGTGVYLRDLHDHAVRVIETVETYRDILGGILDTYLTTASQRMNEVMKVLTVIATLFIPVTFIAGVWGMNFQYMPELHQKWGYPTALGLMGAIMVVMLIWFRNKRWI